MPEPTLDDVALHLLQLEPDDVDELGRVREQLAALVFGNRVAVAAHPMLAGAIRALKPLADGTAADPAAAIREAGRLLQRAVEAEPQPVPAPPRVVSAPGTRPDVARLASHDEVK